MKNNEDLQRDVLDAIKWEPLLNAAEIGVTVKDGIVTLTGIVDSFTKKSEAEFAAKNVAGVKAVVENILVEYENNFTKSDNEIAGEVLNALKWNYEVPSERVTVKVENGWVTLEGELKWNYQKEATKKSAANLAGVVGVTNNIIVKSTAQDEIEQKSIERALIRNWAIDNKDIHVHVSGNKVTLNGTTQSLYQKEQAEKIAWNAPGVWEVANQLEVAFEI